MDTNRFDDIFLVKGAIPFLAGFYIGMDDEKAQERLDNLYGNQNEQLTENLLSRYSVSYEYELFESENLLKKIILVFPQECSYKDTVLLIDYFNNRFYHEKIHKEIENDSGGNLIKFRVDFSNYYYSCSFFNNDGKFFIQLEGLVAYPSLYKAFYLVGTDSDLKGFIHKSLSFSYNETNKDTILNDLFPVYNGQPNVALDHYQAY